MAERDSKQPRAQPPPRQSIDEQLDEALANSFPASDPVSFVTSQTEEDWCDEPQSQTEVTPREGDS